MQTFGEYFGQGLGKCLERDPVRRQHNSEKHTSWGDGALYYATTYTSEYVNKSSRIKVHKRVLSLPEMPVAGSVPHSMPQADKYLLDKFHIHTKESFHRFPKKYSLPSSTACSKEIESAALWYNTPGDSGCSPKENLCL